MEKNVCIVNFNTTELTTAAIQSLWKHTPDCKVTVFDNSDKEPFPEMEGVRIIDNTKGLVIDFDKFLSEYPDKQDNANNWGSDKHIYTIDKLFDLCPDGFLLLDSDILIKKDVSDLFDESVAYCGEERSYEKVNTLPRVLPFICWINVPVCKEHGIRYFDKSRNMRLTKSKRLYDTGASFYEDCHKHNLPVRKITASDYLVHFGKGSWAKKSAYKDWLDKYSELYMDKKKESSEEKYMVLIPYFSGGAQGRELEYAIAGWRRHFKEPYEIVIVGDYHPVVDTGDDIVYIECPRVGEQSPENYRPHIDFVNKFKKVRELYPNAKGFIYGSDDCYAVNDFDIHDIKVIKQNGPKISDNRAETAWGREKIKTRNLLKSEGYPIRNFVTHLPLWIEWDKLEELWKKYDMEHNSYIFEDLYFNIFYPTRIPEQLHIDHDRYKCGVYRPNPRLEYIQNAFRQKIWIQNSVEGWIPALDKMLADYYKI